MRHYEMMIILDPSLEERTVQPSLDQFLNVVTTGGGTVDKVDVWAGGGSRTRSTKSQRASIRSLT